MLFMIKALCWIFFGAVVRNLVFKQRSLDQTFGFSDGRGYNFSCWQHWTMEKIIKEALCLPGASADTKETE